MLKKPHPDAKFWFVASTDPVEPAAITLSNLPDEVIKRYASSRPLHRRGPAELEQPDPTVQPGRPATEEPKPEDA